MYSSNHVIENANGDFTFTKPSPMTSKRQGMAVVYPIEEGSPGRMIYPPKQQENKLLNQSNSNGLNGHAEPIEQIRSNGVGLDKKVTILSLDSESKKRRDKRSKKSSSCLSCISKKGKY
ncbi:unnamed protein product [Owenia fusiformis]|uniref:Uncharacterized protein n=1 Tax=Owenia fusiformis TaxID=6347 RepID=A0A8J1UBV3_OWEFU|nr:unnamed protein product [Owenia fusiformis]